MTNNNNISKKQKQILQKIIKGRQDPIEWINNNVYISHPKRGKIKFNLYPFQKTFLKIVLLKHFIVTLKSRQVGMSTITQAYCLWCALHYSKFEILIISANRDNATSFLRKLREMYNNLDNDYKTFIPATSDNKLSMEFANGSKITTMAATASSSRGESVNLLVFDEAAFINNVDEVYRGTMPTISRAANDSGDNKNSKPYGCFVISCTPKDTYVYTDKGIKQIGDFVDDSKINGYKIEKYNVLGRDKLRTGDLFFNNGYHDTKIITTVHSQVETTFNHKFWACKNGNFGWYKSEELDIGDYIALQYGMEVWGNNDDISDFKKEESLIKTHGRVNFGDKITPDLAYFLGLFLAEGNALYKKSKVSGKNKSGVVQISCGDDVSDILKKLDLKYTLKSDNVHYLICNKDLVRFLEYLGFDITKKAKEKIIPKRLLEMSRENIIAMLQGIFDGDGFSRKDKGTIGIGLSSLEFIKQIRLLLLNFGIKTLYRHAIVKPTKKVKVFSNNYNLEFSKESSKIFYEKIGFRFQRKNDNKKYLNYKQTSLKNDIIPISIKNIKSIIDKYIIERDRFKSIRNGNQKYLSKYKSLQLKELLKDKELTEEENKLFDNIQENIQWDLITKIEYDKKETYDFSLPESDDFWCHSVVYNSLIGHQTPNGTGSIGEWYYQMYQGAISGENGFTPIKVHWSAVDEYDDKWYIEQCKILNWDYRKIAAELELSFVSSGMTYLPNKLLDTIQIRDPKIISDDKSIWIWKEPEKDHKYIMGVDVAYGEGGGDFSAFTILDVGTLEQVAEFNSNTVIIDKFAEIVAHYGILYNNCLVNIERNALGVILIQKLLKKHGLTGLNLFQDKSNKNLYEIKGNFTGKDIYNSSDYGTVVTGISRELILSNLYTYFIESYTDLNDDSVEDELSKKEMFLALKEKNIKGEKTVKKLGLLSSERLYHQLLGFMVNSNGRPQGKKDDLVFAMAHALYCYTKSKQVLLQNYVKLNSAFSGGGERGEIQNMIDFHKKFNGPLGNYTVEEYKNYVMSDEEFDEFNRMENNKIKRGRPKTNKLLNIWKGF